MMDVSNTHSRTHLHEKQLKNQNKNAHDGTRQDCPMSLKKKFRFCCVFSIFELGSIKTANRFSNENGERKDALDWIENVFFFRHEENAHEILKFSVCLEILQFSIIIKA